MELIYRFKVLDPIDRVPEELWMELRDIVQEGVIKTIPEKKKCRNAKWLSDKALQTVEKRKEAEVERFYEDLQDLLELTPKKDVLFIIGDWNAKVGSGGTPGVTDKFGLGIQNETGQRLTKFCQENALVIANALFQ